MQARPTRRAAPRSCRATYGQVLTWNAAPIAAYFSAACGGKGESAEAAFDLPKGSAPYLPAVDDGDSDAAKPHLAWTVRIPLAQLSSKLRKAGRIKGELVELSVSQTTPSGRARELRLVVKGGGALTLRASELRQLAGYTQLPSLAFTVEVDHGAALFRGRGSGHGVGLCQWGARGRALAGQTYRTILEHYYPGAELRQMY